jgi:hypothetical protein
MCAEHYALSKQRAMKQNEEVGGGSADGKSGISSSIGNRNNSMQPPASANDSSTEDEDDSAAAAAAATAKAAAASLDCQRILPGMNVLMGGCHVARLAISNGGRDGSAHATLHAHAVSGDVQVTPDGHVYTSPSSSPSPSPSHPPPPPIFRHCFNLRLCLVLVFA